ncbi:alpha/beta fold hydrolase [Tsukamurella ocularis]|uniref:alpha/beta fold hydrolase n=1 Tax=Tsukamurella ocularis TaxID=1970234 RepID=UPI0021670B1C|nr:alpha/beta hydrolase [Tsukamurella ocularis]MCS3780103.1 pimeloyl-ACP methyl ester carboxylesterase [Tsukamurella ocularis]MCS3786343.1 pimeloyl-ACP methyl ester carboxylesterase [Tsukamurella ocularis]MCS3849707.1 pimeloyl-ACP methyl ester carboxylesterase [Tsukamurella ocularis]
MTQVRQRVALIHGHRRAYRIGGSGPALLLIHGMADNSSTFEPILERLAERYTVIVPDLLGHGLSGRPRADYSLPAFTNAMRDLLLYLGIERATLVGHSLGGGIAGQFAYQYPHMVERLVFVDTGGVTRSVSPVLRAVSLPMSEIAIRSLALPGVLPVASAALDLLGRVPIKLFVDNADCARVLAGLPHAGTPRAFTRTLRAVIDPLGQVVTMLDRTYVADSLPVLVVWGSNDPIIPVEHAHLLHASLPLSRLEVFDGAGHFPFRSDPERFLAVLNEFIDGTDPARLTTADLQDALRRDADLDADVDATAETPA